MVQAQRLEKTAVAARCLLRRADRGRCRHGTLRRGVRQQDRCSTSPPKCATCPISNCSGCRATRATPSCARTVRCAEFRPGRLRKRCAWNASVSKRQASPAHCLGRWYRHVRRFQRSRRARRNPGRLLRADGFALWLARPAFRECALLRLHGDQPALAGSRRAECRAEGDERGIRHAEIGDAGNSGHLALRRACADHREARQQPSRSATQSC